MIEEHDANAPIGALDDRFDLLEQLGSGGMGVVYRAFDRERAVQVALKTLRSVNPDQVLRFKAEFRALRDLRHPNLIELGELFERDGSWYFTMELIEGVGFLEYVRGAVRLADSSSTESTTLEGSATGVETSVETPPHISERLSAMSAERDIPRLPRAQCDEERLRHTLAGLARGLSALHDAGKVHRDIKPSNIIVDDAGRVVLLDFGVVAELSASRTFERDRLVGTVKYMAPEQTAGADVGPAADWYAVGVLMFQALTGQLPFVGPPEHVLASKRSLNAPRPSSYADGIAADLERLCGALLEREPARRAGAEAVFDTLGVARSTDSWVLTAPATEGRLFVGREREIDALEAAFDDSRDRAVCVFVEGESGVGKSALVDHFVETQRADEPHLVVLRGRCHERERVSYNAFDGVIDDLSRYLLGRRAAKLERLVPDRVAALLQLFPALRAVTVFADAAAVRRIGTQATDARGDAFAALRKLLAGLGTRRALLLVIDDIQWADRDSIALLDELVHGPGSPPLCLVATQRTGAGDAVSERVASVAEDSRRLELSGLTEEESEQLVRKLIAAADADRDDADAAQIAAEARGHPMFIHELVQHTEQTPTGGPVRLDDAIWNRARRLDRDALELLEAVAVAGAPIPQSVAFAAIGITTRQASARVAALQSGAFVRVAGARGHHQIETYHDRVREAVYGNVPAPRRRALHRAIAEALEDSGAPPDALFQQFEAAGETERANRYVGAAAEAAFATMAFGRAAELYRRAVDAERDPDRKADLQIILGDALCNDGRSLEAADCFLAAAAQASDPIRKLDLQRRAAERLLMSGHLQRGVETTQVVLGELGMALPGTKLRTLSSILWNQLKLRRHSLTWKRRDVSERDRVKADVFWSLACGFSMVELLLGAYFATRSSTLALKHGDPEQIARALSSAAIGAALMGRRSQVEQLLAATDRAADEADSPVSRFYGKHSSAAAKFVKDNDWFGCLEAIREVRALWHEAGRGPGWETDVITHFEIASYQMLGQYQEVARLVQAAVRDGKRTGNLFIEVSLRVRFAAQHLIEGRWRDALEDIDDALASWLPESGSFGNQRAWTLWSRTRIAQCSGELERFVPDLDAEWKAMRRSLLARLPLFRLEWYPTYGAYLCAKAHLAKHRGEHSEHARLCRQAQRYADGLSKMTAAAAPQSEQVLRAMIAWARGDEERAVVDTRLALEAQRDHPTLVFEWPLQYRLGQLLGGDEGAALIAEAEREAAVRGITDLRRFAEIAIPTADFAA